MRRRIDGAPSSHKRHIIIACIAAALAAFFIFSIVNIQEKRSFVKNERDLLQDEIDETRSALESIDRSLQAAESPNAHERLLREQFRVVSEGEEIIVIIPDE